MHPLFKNRFHAGHLLARRLVAYAAHQDVLVLALPRGGVPLGYMVARALAVPLDILMVRKLGLPSQPEYALGAVSGEEMCLLHRDKIQSSGTDLATVHALIDREKAELSRREILYRAGKPALPLHNKIVILVDDGIATGSSMSVAIRAARRMKPAKIIVAVPVAPRASRKALASIADEVICLHSPFPFTSVGEWYKDFRQVSDAVVMHLLEKHWTQVTRAKTGIPRHSDPCYPAEGGVALSSTNIPGP